MVLKRILGQGLEEECDGSSAPSESKRSRLVFAGMREFMGAQCMQRHLSKLEPFLRRVVQEEVQNALNHHVRSAPGLPTTTLSQPTITKHYQLLFHNTLPHTIYTGSRIEAEGGVPVQIMIVDSCSKSIISSGPLASTKIEILALDGDFGGENEWSEKYFVDNIVRERDGKRPLLTGELTISLSKGVAYVNDATFTDNSSWLRSRKFRLGARVCPSKLMEGRVREAVTEAFLVKDHRGESYRKHHPPSLNDEVWRLEKVGKDGAFHKRLTKNEIYTVQDFLRNLIMDPSKLRCASGNGMSNKIWEATIEHARESVMDDKLYSYCRGHGVLLIFNSIFQLIGAIIDRLYHPVDEMTASQKVRVKICNVFFTMNKLKEVAYRNQNDITELKLPAIDAAISLPVSSWSEPQLPDITGTLQEEPNTHQLSLQQQSESHESCHGLLEDLNQPVQRFNSCNNYSFSGREFFEQQYVGYNSDFELLTSSPMPPPLCDHGKVPCQTSDDVSVHHVPRSPHGDTSSRIGSSGWVKLMAVLKWMSISRQLAARRAAVAANMSMITENGYPTLRTMYTNEATPGW
ncbi:hypothetical protein KSP40_PGU013035 [Platanthera guangdongensis]|uniref:Calmodulin-binding protein n=1 Tax=Platanthera guangdongensis TaxID=2320717 RepID=A0ABR2MLR6_9ASPA